MNSLIFYTGISTKEKSLVPKNPTTPSRSARRRLSISAHEPKKYTSRRITLTAIAAVAGIVGAIAAVVSATVAVPDLPPLVSDRPLESNLLILELQDSPIPQLSWNANTWKSSYGIADVAVECRMRASRKEGCRKDFPAVYYALPNVNGGAEVGQADADPTQDRSVCERVRYDSISLQISEGGYYCLRTPTRLVGLRPESLPMADEIITVRIYATAWEHR